LLQGRKVVVLTEATATIQNSDTGAITTYRRFNKPALGPGRHFRRFLCDSCAARSGASSVFIGRRASLKRSLTGESASSGVGSKHGSVVLLLREIVMGEQAGPCLVQLLSPSNEYALALCREEINVCFFEFAI
jgi:hypothetical protein